jgi:hypothetical protein
MQKTLRSVTPLLRKMSSLHSPTLMRSFGTNYSIHIDFDQDRRSYENLKDYDLFIFKAASNSGSGIAKPVLWKRIPVTQLMEINWDVDYGIYTSLNVLGKHDRVQATNYWPAKFGDEVVVEQSRDVSGKYNSGTSTSNSFLLTNNTDDVITGGLYLESDGHSPLAPFCAFQVNGNMGVTMTPIQKAIIYFSRDPMKVGSVIKTEYSRAALVDFTNVAPDRGDFRVEISVKNQTWPDDQPWLTKGTIHEALRPDFDNFKKSSGDKVRLI